MWKEIKREAGKRQELRVLNPTERPRRCSRGRAHLGSDVKHEEHGEGVRHNPEGEAG